MIRGRPHLNFVVLRLERNTDTTSAVSAQWAPRWRAVTNSKQFSLWPTIKIDYQYVLLLILLTRVRGENAEGSEKPRVIQSPSGDETIAGLVGEVDGLLANLFQWPRQPGDGQRQRRRDLTRLTVKQGRTTYFYIRIRISYPETPRSTRDGSINISHAAPKHYIHKNMSFDDSFDLTGEVSFNTKTRAHRRPPDTGNDKRTRSSNLEYEIAGRPRTRSENCPHTGQKHGKK